MWLLVKITGELIGIAVALIAAGMAGWAVLIKVMNWAMVEVMESDLEKARAEREIKMQNLAEEYEEEKRQMEMWEAREKARMERMAKRAGEREERKGQSESIEEWRQKVEKEWREEWEESQGWRLSGEEDG